MFGMRTGVTPSPNHQHTIFDFQLANFTTGQVGIQNLERACPAPFSDFMIPKMVLWCDPPIETKNDNPPSPKASAWRGKSAYILSDFGVTKKKIKHRPASPNTRIACDGLRRAHATPTIPFESSVGGLVRLGSSDCSPST